MGFFSTGGDKRGSLPIDVLGGETRLIPVVKTGGGSCVVDGFLTTLRDGGGGASSSRPWLRNLEFRVLTVFDLFSGSRSSMEKVGLTLGTAGAAGTGFDFFSSPSRDFFGIFPSFVNFSGCNSARVLATLSASDISGSLSFFFSFSERLALREDEDLEEEDEDLWCELLCRSLSLSLSLLLLLLLDLCFDEEDEELLLLLPLCDE